MNRIEIKNTTKDLSKQEVKSFVRQKENIRILGFWRFHLGLYNLSGRDTSKWVNRVFRKLGEEPVVFDEDASKISVNQLNVLLQNKGYLRGYVKDAIIQVAPKKVKVRYDIFPSERYKINHVQYKVEDDSLKELIESDSLKTLLKRGRPFESELHDRERIRIANKLKNRGYYLFSKEYVYYIADSTIGNQLVNDTLVVKKALVSDSLGNSMEVSHRKYKYRNVYYIFKDITSSVNERGGEEPFDTLKYSDSFFLYRNKIGVHPAVIYNSSYILPGELYSKNNVDKTQMLLSSLNILRYVDIKFEVVDDTLHDIGSLDVYIQLLPSTQQSFTIEVEGTNASGNLGAASNLKYQHRNLLKGAEVFDFNLRGSAERELTRGGDDELNTFEIGADGGIVFPKFLIPVSIEGFRKRYNPKTSIKVAYNYQERPDYTRTIASLRFGYNWRPTRYVTHYLSLSDMNYVSLPYIDPVFWDFIDSTFLRNSYEDHFILNSSYSLIFNNQLIPNQKNYFYGRFNIELAGNLLNGVSSLWKNKNDSIESYKIFGVPFAQYVKADIDLRYHYSSNNINSFAYRIFAGVGYPYGNLEVLPFEKRYFTGGANGIRAWPVRGLGPGSYQEKSLSYYNQTADIKLELNAEYRFKLFWLLEGAIFADAGNVWNIRGSVDDGLFQWKSFYKQIAVGVGTGLRVDFSYFLFRLDMGVKARDPSRKPGDRWMLGKYRTRWDDIAFNIAIGYPF